MCGCIEIIVLFLSILLIFISLRIQCRKESHPIFNVYQRPNGVYWFKVAIIYLVLSLRKYINYIKVKFQNEKSLERFLETPHKHSRHEKPIDAVYFNAADHQGNHLVLGTARRKGTLVDGLLFLKIQDAGSGLLESPKMPGTALYQTKERDEFEAEGIKVECLKPMRYWHISYNGKMKSHKNKDQLYDVVIDVTYSSHLPYFNFDCDMNSLTMAKCMAREKWSREYFQMLKENHQTHYEQHGDLDGTATINDIKYPINMQCMRDHSFGDHRDWKDIHKYVFHLFATENGDRFTIGNFCIPISFSNFLMGYVYSASEKKMYPVETSDFLLYQHGENGIPPLDYAFTITAGGKSYTIQVNVVDSPHFYISRDWECKVTERLCTFEVNGLKGWGASEWQCRNMHGKNVPDFVE